MKNILSIALLFGFFVLGCDAGDIISDTGTIRFNSIEGGFYGIVADNGEYYDPLNLPEKFKQDSLRVKFTAVEAKAQASFHMWGTIVEITHIEKLRE